MPKREMSVEPGGEAGALIGLARENGLQGVRESQAKLRVGLEHDDLVALAQRQEEEGRIRILAFFPLFLIARSSLDFLAGKIVAIISKHHAAHPEERGLALDKLRHRLEAPPKVLALAVRLLAHDGTLRQEGPSLALSVFKRRLAPRDEQLLEAFEERCRLGPAPVLADEEIRADLRLTPQKFESLAAVLVDRNRIVRTKEGYIVARPWLDGIVDRLRAARKAELKVSVFKDLTGLSRKYAIPLLELLDERGVTRRNGASRDIVREEPSS